MSIENLQNEPVFIRSPFIIEIDEPLQTEGKVEVFIWNRQDTPPTTPNYVLNKKIPNSSNLELTFNVSHYVKEEINFLEKSEVSYNNIFAEIDQDQWAFVKIKRYVKFNGDLDFTALDTKTYIALNGYGYYEQGYNPNLGSILLDQGVYEYWLDPNNLPTPGPQNDLNRYGDVKVVLPPETYSMRYTDLVTGDVFIAPVPANRYVAQIFLVYPLYTQNGNLVEYLDDLDEVIWTCTMMPITECKYQVHTIDIVNKYGAWQRTFAYKASRKTLSVNVEKYDLFSRELINYNTNSPENKLFNVNGRKKIKLNTGWIYNDTYNDLVLEPMMLSERISIDNNPVIMETRSTELFENINKHVINYELTFEYAYDVINNVV